MNRDELRQILEAEGVPSHFYSLSGGHPEDASVLDRFPGGWVYYYSERGGEWDRQFFDDEDAACRHLLEQIITGVLPLLGRHDTHFEAVYRAETEEEQEPKDPE